MTATTPRSCGGYRPLRLTLAGFRGIRDGLGRPSLTLDLTGFGDASLIAIAGANGRGKTTVMDNLHPYLVMPSRAGADGLGAFSYYDHVYLPESSKELVWQHGGRTYRTHLVFRVNGKRKTEAYLFEQTGLAAWAPVQLADGTVCDGKVETYERAVVAILGPQETFFASVFSAQGKRPISAYKNAEVKSLLADLLNLATVRAAGDKAAEVVRQLKAALIMLRQTVARDDETLARMSQQIAALDGADRALVAAVNAKSEAARRLDEARHAAAAVGAEHDAAKTHEEQRVALQADHSQLRESFERDRNRIAEDHRVLGRRMQALAQRVNIRTGRLKDQRGALERRLESLARTLERAATVGRADRRLPVAEQIAKVRSSRLGELAERAQACAKLGADLARLEAEIAGIEREAGQVALREQDLRRRFGLAEEVPCAGTDLTGRCQLLGDARDAKALLPDAGAKMARLQERKHQALANALKVRQQIDALSGAGNQLEVAGRRSTVAADRARRYAVLAAQLEDVVRAGDERRAAKAELDQLPSLTTDWTEDELQERTAIEESLGRLQHEEQERGLAFERARQAKEAQLAKLPPPFDAARVERLQVAVARAEAEQRVAEGAYVEAVRRNEQLLSLQASLKTQRAQRADACEQIGSIERHIAAWTLLAKCLSNDGVIALEIDDAGPTLARLSNDLLAACYGPRYTLSITTQSETAKGGMREDFDIVVHDGQTGETKSLRLVSGGERVWINECLTRAIALYLAGHTGRRFGTLFCDEADGPLDPDHKRMFMAMKREVLRLGGYECEFFVSQTPELTSMADAAIDLDTMLAEQAKSTMG